MPSHDSRVLRTPPASRGPQDGVPALGKGLNWGSAERPECCPGAPWGGLGPGGLWLTGVEMQQQDRSGRDGASAASQLLQPRVLEHFTIRASFMELLSPQIKPSCLFLHLKGSLCYPDSEKCHEGKARVMPPLSNP